MKLSYIFFVFMLFIGCSDTPKAQTLTQTKSFSNIDYYSDYHEMLVPSPFINIETFTYMGNTSATLKYLILADKLGTLYSTKLP